MPQRHSDCCGSGIGRLLTFVNVEFDAIQRLLTGYERTLIPVKFVVAIVCKRAEAEVGGDYLTPATAAALGGPVSAANVLLALVMHFFLPPS